MQQVFTPCRVSKIFGRSRAWAYYQIERGYIQAVTVDGRQMVTAAELNRYQAAQPLFVDSIGRRFFSQPGVPPRGEMKASENVAIKFTPGERAAVRAVAEANDLTVSDFCRMAINEAVAEFQEGQTPCRLTHRKRPRRTA